MSASTSSPEILKLVANWSDLYQQHFYNLALFEMQTALDYRPDHPLLWFFKGITQLAQRDAKGARVSFDKARELSVNAIEEPELQGIAGKLQQGLLIAENALARDAMPAAPKSPLEWLEGAMPELSVKKKATAPEARPAIAAAASVLSSAVATAAANGERFIFSPTTSGSPASSPSVAKPAPRSPVVTTTGAGQLQMSSGEVAKPAWEQWENQLRKHVDAGEYDKAMSQVNLALQRHSTDHWLTEWRARIYEKQGNRALAAENMLEAARLAFEQKHPDKAAALGREVILLSNNNNDTLLRSGAALAGIGLTAAAAEALRHAETLSRRANDHPRLVAALRQLAQLYPNNSTYGHELALLAGKIPQAKQVDVNPANAPVRKQAQQSPVKGKKNRPSVEMKATIAGKPTQGIAAAQVIVSGVAMFVALVGGLAGSPVLPIIVLIIHNIISGGISKAANGAATANGMRRFAIFVIILSFVIGAFRP